MEIPYSLHKDIVHVYGDVDAHPETYVTNPHHGGKVVCEAHGGFLSRAKGFYFSKSRQLWWCEECMHKAISVDSAA